MEIKEQLNLIDDQHRKAMRDRMTKLFGEDFYTKKQKQRRKDKRKWAD